MSETVGVIGLGNMGGAMSANLVNAGFDVVGFDVADSARHAASERGVRLAESACGVLEAAETTITSLPTPAALHAVAAELAGRAWSGRVVVETGTLSLADKNAAREVLDGAGVTLIDCPLSGTGHQARTGDLAVFASGDEAAVRRCESLFAGFSRRHDYCGEFGNGSRMKFVANVLIGIHNVAAAEAMVLGMKSGLDPHLVYDVIGESAGTSRMFQVRAKLMAENDYTDVGATNRLFSKDIDVISAFAAEIGCPVSLFTAAAQPYRALMGRGMADLDSASVCKILEETAGIER